MHTNMHTQVQPIQLPFEIISRSHQIELRSRLYLHHTPLGAQRNQAGVVQPGHPNGFGSTVVNDWLITQGFGRDTKVIARAKGIHIQAGKDSTDYYVSFNMVFEHEWCKGSTLQVMGTVVEHGEWAIVGGTGRFTMAQGIIYKKFREQKSDGNVIELEINAFYIPLKRS